MSFSKQNKAFTDGFIKNSDKVIKEAAIGMFSDIINDSPMGSGAFVNGWEVSGEGMFNASNTSTAAAKIAEMTSAVNSLPDHAEIMMGNNAPYGNQLEFGSSDQAPMGFLRINTLNWDSRVDADARNDLG